MESEKQVVRAAAYVRLSARELTQDNTFTLTCFRYDDYAKQHPGWKFGTLYWDEDCKNKNEKNLPGLSALISDCKAGKVDVVLVKSISYLTREFNDAISVIETLRNLNPPVAILFENEQVQTGGNEDILLNR